MDIQFARVNYGAVFDGKITSIMNLDHKDSTTQS